MRSTPLGLPTLDRFPQFSAFAPIYRTSAFQVMPKTAEIDQTWPFFPLPSSAVALLRLPATINKIRMFPRFFASSDMPQTRDSALKTSGLEGDDIMVDMKSYDGENADITKDIIACAIEVHRTLGGPGILEKVYQHALAYELQAHGHRAQIEAPCPIVYKGRDLSDPEHPLRIDILVDDTVVVECKAGAYNPVYAAQCLTYLRLKKLKTGLVINFGLPKLVDGVERVSN